MAVLSVSSAVLLLALKTLADHSVTFDISKNGQGLFNCNSSDVNLDVGRNETIYVWVLGYTLHYPTCFGGDVRASPILRPDNFEHLNQTYNLAKVNTANLKSERWICTFLILKNRKYIILKSQLYTYKGDTYAQVNCTVWVNVSNTDTDTKAIYYIVGGCAIGLTLIVIAQFVVIIYLRRKGPKSSKLEHIRRRTPNLERDEARYSVGPGQRKNSRKNKEDDIYDTLDDLLPVPRRPSSFDISKWAPLPPPMDDSCCSDDDHIYKGGTTLNKMFSVSPEPPPIETLPRKRGKKNGPKPALKPKPSSSSAMKQPEMELEHYDYADSEMSCTDSLNRALMKGKKPVPKLPKKIVENPSVSPHMSAKLVPAIPGGAVLINELTNKFNNDFKLKNVANPKSSIAGWQKEAGRENAREMTPPDARAVRSPQSYRAPDQQRPRPSGIPFPHDVPPPFATVPRINKEPPKAMVSPVQPAPAPMPATPAPLPQKGATKPYMQGKSGGFAKPLPPPLQTDDFYVPIDDPADTQNPVDTHNPNHTQNPVDSQNPVHTQHPAYTSHPDDTQNDMDDEFDREDDLEPSHMYMNSVDVVSLQHRHVHRQH